MLHLKTITECVVVLTHKITDTELRASGYGLSVTTIVSKEKTMKNA